MKKPLLTITILFSLSLVGACGGDGAGDDNASGDGDVVGDGDGDGDGDGGGEDGSGGSGDTGGSTAAGGTSSSGGAAGDGGSPTGGAGVGDGGANTGGQGTGGTTTGGASSGTGGLPAICGCDAPSRPVCGIDGVNYDAACGQQCVVVDVECDGICPCAGCGCQVVDGNACDNYERQWVCSGTEHSDAAFLEQGCDPLPTGTIRYCCGIQVVPEDFCPMIQ